MDLFKELHNSDKFVKFLNSTFIVFIPKKRSPRKFKELRPISLLGCIYKLIAKVLAKSFSRVLGEVIGECQHAFVEGRQMLNAMMAANETVDDLMARENDGLVCKLDMEKAYGHVSWNFVKYMLKRMGFWQK